LKNNRKIASIWSIEINHKSEVSPGHYYLFASRHFVPWVRQIFDNREDPQRYKAWILLRKGCGLR
jgi:hypothetical protein